MAEEGAGAQLNPVVRYASMAQRIVAGVLLVLMFVVVIAATIRLAVDEVGAVLGFRVDLSETFAAEARFFDVLGLFLAILIGLELVETVVVYFREHSLHAEVVVLVALVALARKIVLMDVGTYEPLAVVGIGVLTLGLGGTYFLLKSADRC